LGVGSLSLSLSFIFTCLFVGHFLSLFCFSISFIYYIQNVATLREEEQGGGTTNETTSPSSDNDNSSTPSNRRRRRPIQEVQYDSLHRPLNRKTGDDGNWEVGNPVDPTTGLLYDPEPWSSLNSNNADWADLIPTFLQHGYESSLGMKTMSKNPLLMVERSYNPPPLRQQLLEIVMEECQVPATFFGRDATLACYACGRTTSTVIDIGYSGTTVTPVYEGYVEQKGIRRSPVGSMAMDELAMEQLKSLLDKKTTLQPLYQVRNPKVTNRHPAFHRLALLEIAKDCREMGAGQSINTAASKSLQVPSMSFTLPDGQTVDIPSSSRFDVADLVLGGRPSTDNNNNGDNLQQREDALNAMKQKYNSMIMTALAEDNEDYEEMDEDDHEDDDDDDDEDDRMLLDAKEKKKQASKYTEATAVGVASRRTTRGGAKAAAAAAKTVAAAVAKKQHKVRFSNRILQKACAPYLQAQMEQQLTASPVASMVCDAAFRCDRDQQASVLGNVVLCGGGACIGPTDPAVPDLLREQMEAIIHTHTPGWRVKVLSPGMQERAICSWLGGSILGSLGTFHDMWITKAEYEEWGSAIINRKCP
jgi:actin-related protein